MTKLYLLDESPPAGTPTTDQSTAWPSGTGRISANQSGGSRSLSASISVPAGQTGTGITHDADQNEDDWLMRIFGFDLRDSLTVIPAQNWTIAGAGEESNAAANTWLGWSLYVYRPGTGVLGYIHDVHSQSMTEYGTSELGRVQTFAGSAVSGIQSGDLLVLEVWHHVLQSMNSAYTSAFYYDGTTEPVEGVAVSSAASYLQSNVPIVGYMEQEAFRGRNDDGNETTATWKAAQDADWSQAPDENLRVRFRIAEASAAEGIGSPSLRLQYRLNGGSWTNVAVADEAVITAPSPNVADQSATTEQLTGASGTWQAGTFDETDGSAGLLSSLDSGEYTEVEYCVQIVSGLVSSNDIIELRLVNVAGGSSAAQVEVWSQVPSITVVEGAVSQGPAASTIPTLTQSADGDVAVAGAASSSVAPTQSASGTVSVSGAASSSVAPTQSAAGGVLVAGAASSTIPATEQSATGTVVFPEITGAAASTIPAATQAAGGDVEVSGAAASSVAIEQSATGSVDVAGAASSSVAPTQSATGAVIVSGPAVSTMPALEQSASGTVGALPEITGPAVSTMPALSQAASGTVDVAGAASSDVSISQAASGTVEVQGAASSPISAEQAATGSVQVSGSAASSIAVESSASGTVSGPQGAASSTIPAVVSEATGVVGEAPVFGPAASVIPALSQTASGTVSVAGAAQSIIAATESAGAGANLVSGPMTSDAPAAVSSASGTTSGPTGPAASVIPALESSALGEVLVLGDGTTLIPLVVSQAVGSTGRNGAIFSIIPAVISTAFGEIPTLGVIRSGGRPSGRFSGVGGRGRWSAGRPHRPDVGG